MSLTKAEILAELCYYDRRNPQGVVQYHPDADDPPPRNGCACDACFYGRDRLAVYCLELIENQEKGNPKNG